MRNGKPYLDKRFEKIIIMCQKARDKYPIEYEIKYKNKIDKFCVEILTDNLLDNCEARDFAEQLCVVNGLQKVLPLYN